MKPIWWIALAASITASAIVSFALMRATRWDPAATFVLEIDADHPYDDGLSPDQALARTARVLRDRADKLGVRALAAGRRVTVQLRRGADRAHAMSILTRPARLELVLVDNDSDYMGRIAGSLATDPVAGVELGHDRWTMSDTSALQRDVYVRADDLDVLTNGWGVLTHRLPLPPDRAVVFEQTQRSDDGKSSWRSYLVTRHATLTGDAIADAELTHDPESGRPEVSISFDSDGAKRLEALTAAAVNRKLAIVLDGRVTSAPIVEGKISGGWARITLGGSADPFRLTQEGKDLVAVLRAGALAAPVRVVAR